MKRLAGVLLLENQGEILVIQRAQHLRFQPGYWSFPGGGVETSDGNGSKRERAAKAALRECEEEVGIALDNTAFTSLRLLGRWQTPTYAEPGFDTFFFLLQIDGDRPRVDANPEVATWQWLSPTAFRQQWQKAHKIASRPVLEALEAVEQPGPPRNHNSMEVRDFLCMGGQALYLPLATATLPPATHTNCVLLPTPSGFYLVDPAPIDPKERKLLFQCVQDKVQRYGPPLGLILSHLHYDHLGAAQWLAERLKIPILASRATDEDLRSGAGSGLSAGGASGGGVVTIERYLQEGDRFGVWRVLETPGHARGHLCFYSEVEQTLICGDMCAGRGTILIEPNQGNMSHYLHSLQRLADLKPQLAIPAHGQPLANAAIVLGELRDHRLRREKKILRSLRNHPSKTAYQLTPMAYDDANPSVWPLAALSVESHLIKLAEDGLARRLGDVWLAVDD
ncbi:MAG TPA: hypothetical protein DEB46_14145 [Myxococcales bacterium]|nr:hypothetical protein [Myxococcales bacterium]|tara:strand:+ start:5020 stop:6372 length:1353 start_codon:yes stop_codon:yes gene_type:complete